MELKTLEVRDRATFIPIIAIKPSPRNEDEQYLWDRSGYGRSKEAQESYILISRLVGDSTLVYDPLTWTNRTMHTVHQYLRENWDLVENGQVLDVEYILGEVNQPKVSERVGSLYV